MQQQQPVVTAASQYNENIKAPPATTTCTSDTRADAWQLNSADSRLADQCLAHTDLNWSPSIRLSLADIAGCFQPLADSLGPAAANGDEDADHSMTGRLQHGSAGYGIADSLPSSNEYVVDPHMITVIILLMILPPGMLFFPSKKCKFCHKNLQKSGN